METCRRFTPGSTVEWTSTFISITTWKATPFEMQSMCSRRWLPAAAVNEGGWQVQPDDRTLRNRLEVSRQYRGELSRRRQADGVNIPERHKISARLQDLHHLVENRELER